MAARWAAGHLQADTSRAKPATTTNWWPQPQPSVVVGKVAASGCQRRGSRTSWAGPVGGPWGPKSLAGLPRASQTLQARLGSWGWGAHICGVPAKRQSLGEVMGVHG